MKPLPIKKRLSITEIFVSLQSEGPYAGTPAVFIRLARCNLTEHCGFCDTDHAPRRTMRPTDIINEVIELTEFREVGLVVITGGEPFLQDLAPLVLRLVSEDYVVQIETNGTLYQPGFPYHHEMVSVVCSPKEGKPVHPQLAGKIAAYKYLIAENTEVNERGLPKACSQPIAGEVFLQPIDTKDPERNRGNQLRAVELCLFFGHRFSFQIHKILGIP